MSKNKKNKTIYEPEYEKIVERLREARKEANINQGYVSEKLGKYQSYVSKIEHGDRRIDIIELLELANLYGKDLNYFVEEPEEYIDTEDKKKKKTKLKK